MQKPRALRAGDRVAVVAPASPLDMEVVKRGSAELRRLGFTPVIDRSAYARDRYVAGRPGVRAEALAAAWADPDIAGVFATRGGYGSVQLLRLLDHERFRTRPKVFVGSSDLTAVLTWLTGRCDTVGFHGPMLVNLARGSRGGRGLRSPLAARGRRHAGTAGGTGTRRSGRGLSWRGARAPARWYVVVAARVARDSVLVLRRPMATCC